MKTRLLKIGVAKKTFFYYKSVACFVLNTKKGGKKTQTKKQHPKHFYLVIFLLFSAILVTTLWVWLHRHSWKEILHRIVTKIVTHSTKIQQVSRNTNRESRPLYTGANLKIQLLKEYFFLKELLEYTFTLVKLQKVTVIVLK